AWLGGGADRDTRVRQDGLGGVSPVETDDAPRRMSGRPAHIEAGNRGASAEAPLPHLVGGDLALEDVAAGQPDPLLDVSRTEDLVVDQAVRQVRREAWNQSHDLRGDAVAA